MGFFSSMFGGASSEDVALQKQSAQQFQALANEQNIMFGNDEAALNTIQHAMTPIVNGGAFQYGFSTPEDQNLQNEIMTSGATATANSVAAQQLRDQQMAGGASVLPTGAQSANELMARELGAQKTASELSREKELGYQVGRENFFNAAKAEGDVASISNPTGFANAATNAGQLNLSANKAVDEANANSLGAKLLGGVVSGGLTALTGGIGGLANGGSFLTGAGQAISGQSVTG